MRKSTATKGFSSVYNHFIIVKVSIRKEIAMLAKLYAYAPRMLKKEDILKLEKSKKLKNYPSYPNHKKGTLGELYT